MEKALLVGLGGFLGTLARYGVGVWIGRIKGGSSFPFATLIVNLSGCLAIGLLGGLWEARGLGGGLTRAFLFVGVLGGYTTFSSLGYETFALARSGQTGIAIGSVALQLSAGLAAVWLGYGMGSGLRPGA